jgi:hypothetical protein
LAAALCYPARSHSRTGIQREFASRLSAERSARVPAMSIIVTNRSRRRSLGALSIEIRPASTSSRTVRIAINGGHTRRRQKNEKIYRRARDGGKCRARPLFRCATSRMR